MPKPERVQTSKRWFKAGNARNFMNISKPKGSKQKEWAGMDFSEKKSKPI